MEQLQLVTATIKDDARRILDEIENEVTAFANTHLLVTGAAGFLGTYFLDVVAEFNRRNPATPCTVTAVDRAEPGESRRLRHLAQDPNFTFFAHDVAAPLTQPTRFDWIIHAASIASPTKYRSEPLMTIDVNVNGTWRVLERGQEDESRGVLIMSSSEVYGDPDPAFIPTPEEYFGHVSCTGPRACYDESKRLGETLAMNFFRQYDLPVKVVRPFNVYGPGQSLDDGRIMTDLLAAAVRRETLVLFSDGRPTRSFCYVADAISGVLRVLLAGKPGEVYNVGNDEEETSIGALAETAVDAALEVMGPPAMEVAFATSDEADYLVDNPSRRCPDLSKIRTSLGWQPGVSLHDGIVRSLESYREALKD